MINKSDRNLIRFVLLAITLCFVLASCDTSCEHEISDLLYEQGMFISAKHIPAHTEQSYEPVTHLNFEGELETDMEWITHYVPDQWETDFSCQHGTFTVRRADTMMKFRYTRPGTKVMIHYREISWNVYKKVEGKKILKSTTHMDYDFIDAFVMGKEPESWRNK